MVYLDFDGEQRDFEYWGTIDAAHSGATNPQIFDVWQGVCEDFTPFNINVTTIRAVYEAAQPGHRMQVIVTPTDDAQPGFGGVAVTSSFNNSGEIVCWAFLTTGKNAIEVITHEVGHTLGLSHDGQLPSTEYYPGHGNSTTGWAPIMGVGYSKPVTQWSKGEYPNANNLQDDLQIISTNNNGVAYRGDDHGHATTTASPLNIDANGLVSNEGIIETNTDRDSFRFSTYGGIINLQIDPVPPVQINLPVANLDIKAELLQITSSLTTVIATSDATGTLSASFSQSLDPGDYMVRITGTGRGNLLTGYSDYASLGSYTVTGTVDAGIHSDQFTLAENSPNGTVVGTVPPRADHDNGTLIYRTQRRHRGLRHPSLQRPDHRGGQRAAGLRGSLHPLGRSGGLRTDRHHQRLQGPRDRNHPRGGFPNRCQRAAALPRAARHIAAGTQPRRHLRHHGGCHGSGPRRLRQLFDHRRQ